MTDRRMTTQNGHAREYGVKALTVEASDGVVALGYAGLGQTVGGTQPSRWMASVLQGRNLTVSECLWVIADEMRRHFPPHLLAGWSHLVLAVAWVDGESRVYGLGVTDTGHVGYQRLRIKDPPRPHDLEPASPRVMYTGSGGAWFSTHHSRRWWVRHLCSLAKRHDDGTISQAMVAQRLATLNDLASNGDATVGPTCIVLSRAAEADDGSWSQYNFREHNPEPARAFPTITTVRTHGYKQTDFDFLGIEYESDGHVVVPRDNTLH